MGAQPSPPGKSLPQAEIQRNPTQPRPVLQNPHQMPGLESSPAGSPSPQGAISRDLQAHLVLIRSEKDAVG